LEIVRFLLHRRANVTLQNNDGNTPLHCAAEHGGKVEIVRVLLERWIIANYPRLLVRVSGHYY
jgi:ankyrin repeat protein